MLFPVYLSAPPPHTLSPALLIQVLESIAADLSEKILVTCREAKWIILFGVKHLSIIVRIFQEDKEILVIEPNQAKIDRLISGLSDGLPEKVTLIADKLAVNETMVEWYQYSDSRFDGYFPPGIFRESHPNLDLISAFKCDAKSLSSVIHDWLSPLAEIGKGVLFIDDCTPPSFVNEIQLIFARLESFYVFINRTETPLSMALYKVLDEVKSSLDEAFLLPYSSQPLSHMSWRYNKDIHNESRINTLLNELDVLREENNDFISEKQFLDEQRQSLIYQRDSLLVEHDDLKQQIEHLKCENESLSLRLSHLAQLIDQSAENLLQIKALYTQSVIGNIGSQL